jgi:hypothetical protein
MVVFRPHGDLKRFSGGFANNFSVGEAEPVLE